jgi:glycosyltransferase involved in cell wall biosynthesis
MDAFVLASHREGFPRAAMEASAMALPVVATDVRGCREVVDPGVTGYLVPVRNAGDLAAAILNLSELSRRTELGAAGRQRAERLFDEQRVVRTVLQTYSAVAARTGLRLEGL